MQCTPGGRQAGGEGTNKESERGGQNGNQFCQVHGRANMYKVQFDPTKTMCAHFIRLNVYGASKTSDLGPDKPKPLETLGNPNTGILTIRNYWRWRVEMVAVSVTVSGEVRSYTSEGNTRTCPRSPKTPLSPIGLAFLTPSQWSTFV